MCLFVNCVDVLSLPVGDSCHLTSFLMEQTTAVRIRYLCKHLILCVVAKRRAKGLFPIFHTCSIIALRISSWKPVMGFVDEKEWLW